MPWMVTGPVTVLPVHRKPPVMGSGPVTVLPTKLTPPVLLVICTRPVMRFPGQPVPPAMPDSCAGSPAPPPGSAVRLDRWRCGGRSGQPCQSGLVMLWIVTAAQRWWLYGPSVKAVEKRAVLEEKAERERNQEQRAANRRVPSKPDAE